MNRVDYVLKINEEKLPSSLRAFHYALINCLNADELSALLQRSFNQTGMPRHGALRALERIGESDSDGTQKGKLNELVRHLVAITTGGAYREAIGAAYCVVRLSAVVDREIVRDYVLRVARHRYAAIRRRAHRLAREHWTKAVASEILEAWREYHEESALRSLVFCESADALAACADELLDEGIDDYLISQIVLKVANARPDLLDRLRSQKPISYAYVLAKLGRGISDETARDLIARSSNDDRFGLLLWSLGVLGAWDVLISIEPKLNQFVQQIEEARLAEFDASWGELNSNEGEG